MLHKARSHAPGIVLKRMISSTLLVAGMTSFILASVPNISANDYTFTVNGRTGHISADGKTYDDNGVHQGNYNFTTGIYTDKNGATVDVNNTPGVTVYNANGAEVPKNPAPATSSTDYTFTVNGKTGRISADGKAYDDNGVHQGNYNFTTGIYTDKNGATVDVNNTPGVRIYNPNGTEIPKTPQSSNPACIPDGTFSPPAGATGCSCTHDGCSTGKSICSCTGSGKINPPAGSYTFTVNGKTGYITSDGKAYDNNGVYQGNYNFTTGIYTDKNGGTVDVANNAGIKFYNSNGVEVPKKNTNSLFTDFETYKAWEASITANSYYASDYQVPDYIRMMGLSISDGDEGAYKRYLFFKANPQYAADYANIHRGKKSQFPTDGTTLIKSNLNEMPQEVADYYRQHPAELQSAEGFSMDPVLAYKVKTGEIKIPYGVNATEWLRTHKWTSGGIILNNNVVTLANGQYIGLNGSGGSNYVQMKYDPNTGMIVDFDGTLRDPKTGKATGKVDPNKFYGSGALLITSSTGSSTSTNSSTSSTGSSTNPYAPTLSSSIQNVINAWIVKNIIPRATTLSPTKYSKLLNTLITKLGQIKSATPLSNKSKINVINYLTYELQKLLNANNDDLDFLDLFK